MEETFYFVVRWKNWKLTKEGLFQYIQVGNKNNRVKWMAWRRVEWFT
jgi:hypothetical protein